MKQLDIIIPIHNQLSITKLCLESIKEYTKVNYQFIIIDNNSKDNSNKWIKNYCKKNNIILKYIKNKRNEGVSKSWNQGLKISNADYIAILNNDIIVTPDWDINLISTLQMSNSILLVYPNSMQGEFTEENVKATLKFSHSIQETDVFSGYCFMLKKQCIEKIGYFDEQFSPYLCEDTDYAYRLILNKTHPIKVYSSFVYHLRSQTLKTFDYEKIEAINAKKLYDKYKDCTDLEQFNARNLTTRIADSLNKKTMFIFDTINKFIKITEKKYIKPTVNIETDNIIINKNIETTKTRYKITSPKNFRNDPNITHGTFKYFSEIPQWAINNSRVVIEEEKIPVTEETDIIKKDIKLQISKNNDTIRLECENCKYRTKNKNDLEKHISRRHN